MDKKNLIEIFKEEDEISSITINGENLDSDDGEVSVFVLKGYFVEYKLMNCRKM